MKSFSLTEFSGLIKFGGAFWRGISSNWKAISIVVLCSLLWAFTVANITLPFRFPGMGVSGLAFLAHYAFDFPPHLIIAACNALLLIWSWKNFDLRFLGLTICSIAVFTVSLPVFTAFSLPWPQDKFMAAVINGVFTGFAGGMVFNAGGSGGGLDIIVSVIRRRYGIEVGQCSVFINMGILALSLGVVGLDSVVYGAVGLYVYAITIDNVMRKFERRKQAFIITNIPDEVSAFITSKGKGVTRIEGQGV